MPRRTLIRTLAARPLVARLFAVAGAAAAVAFVIAHHPAVIAGALWTDTIFGASRGRP